MHFTLSALAVQVALSLSVSAAPQPPGYSSGSTIRIAKHSGFVKADKSIDFDKLRIHAESVQVKIRRGFENFMMNTGVKHPKALESAEKRGFDINIADYNHEAWYGILGVGSPPTYFKVLFDTGSSDVLVPASNCDSTCNGRTLYDPSTSSTSQRVGGDFMTSFGPGGGVSVSGEQYTDMVVLGLYTATSQTLGAATHYPTMLQSPFPADGLMGMAFQSISAFNAGSVIQTLVAEGQMDVPAFSFKLSDQIGELYVGGAYQELYTGDFTYVPVTTQGFWQVNMDNIQVNGETMASNVAAIVDTGASFIIGPRADVSSIYEAIDGSTPGPQDGSYILPCDSFPSITLTFGGTSFPILPSALNLGQFWQGSAMCVSGLYGLDVGSSVWIVGDVFLRGVYTTFDFGNARVGFARLA